MNLKGHLNLNQATIDKGQNILLDEAREGAESINDSNYIEINPKIMCNAKDLKN